MKEFKFALFIATLFAIVCVSISIIEEFMGGLI